jgi:hypothetical protein
MNIYAPNSVTARRSSLARVAIYALELLLVLVILGLLLATWMPAIIGGNPP